jgi:hypothetical protein
VEPLARLDSRHVPARMLKVASTGDDDGDHAATAAARARKHVGGEHPTQQLGPRDPARTRRSNQEHAR